MDDQALTVRYDEGVVHAVGEIDMATCGQLDEMLHTLDTGSPAVLDLSEVSFMDSHGLRVLILHNTLRTDDHCDLTILHPSGPVHRLLRITGLESEFHVVTA